MHNFSVLMSVYRKDKPEDVKKAIASITEQQSLKPTEVILMVDGPIPDSLKKVIEGFAQTNPIIKPQWQKVNMGLGKVLEIGLLLCTYELVARMDADDIAVCDRFEKQIDFMVKHPDIAVVGGQISEFINSPNNIIAYRHVPLTPEKCRKYYQDRDPLNHMTVMFRKSAVLASGNYQQWHLDEDTYLWGRMLEKGYEVANLPDVLVKVRVGKEMYERRGGWKYFKSDSGILKWKLHHGLTTSTRYVYNYVVRFVVQVLMPNKIRGWVFQKILRNKD